jgi:hypothetical protein
VPAIVALWTGADHLSQRPTQAVRADLVGIALRLGPRANLEHATVPAWAAPVADTQRHVRTMLTFNANAVDLGLPQELTEPPLPV